MSLINNPYLNLNVIDYNYKQLLEKYKNVYIICNRIDNIIDPSIYNYQIDKDKLNEINKKLILYEVPFKILNNLNHLNKLMILNSEVLKDINKNEYILADANLVLMIVHIKLEDLNYYFNQYKEKNNLIDIYNIIVINEYFDYKNFKSFKYLEDLINMEESNYWSNPYHCNANLTTLFEKRVFNLFNVKINTPNDYLNEMYRTTEYIDPSKIIQISKYKVFSDTTFSKNDINELFEKLNPKQQFLLFSNLLVSKNYCHLVLNNKYILILLNKTIHKYIHLFRYLIGYAWVKFYFDESIKKTFIKKEDPFIFSLDTACELPLFPFSIENPKLNPYMPILVDDTILQASTNIGGISTNEHNGLCNLEEFKLMLNIFTTNKSNNNLFHNINWAENKMAISGSIMTACLQKKHPLVNMFNNISNYEERLTRYFNEYYAIADIDTMILTQDVFEFMDIVQKIFNQIVINICSFSSYAEPNHIKLECYKTGYLFISEADVLEKVCNQSREQLSIIKKSIDSPETIELFKIIINEEFETYKKNIKIDNTNYPDYLDINNIMFKIRIFSQINNENRTTNFKISYKYKITSPHLNHGLEIFMVNYDDFFATVQTFHLPCVRAYYNGDNVYLTPSCISAHMTYMNIDYKYFAGSKSPIEIINKYRMRGFGTWLNANEKNVFFRYSSTDLFWNTFYNINYKNSKTINANEGALSFNHVIFQPRMINHPYFENANPVDISMPYMIPTASQKLSFTDYISRINSKYNTDHQDIKFILNYNTIGKTGFINPLQKWVIEAIYNIFEHSVNTENTTAPIKASNINKYLDISGGYHITNNI